MDYSHLNDPVLDILVRASEAHLPNKEHWWQEGGHSGSAKDTACIILAIDRAVAPAYMHAKAAEEVLYEVGGFPGAHEAMRWNDAPERTFAEVKALQLRAIEARLRLHNIIVVLPKKARHV